MMAARIRDYAFIGQTIDHAIAKAIEIARLIEQRVSFGFNGVEIVVLGTSDPALIYRDWSRSMSGYIGKRVGPFPAPVLTADEQASDARVKAENDARLRASEARYAREAAEKKAALEAKLADCPPATLNRDEWEKGYSAQESGYGRAVFEFADTWARLMEREIAAGATLPLVADECSSAADAGYGITGFMYGCAVSILASAWVHGDELRRWHNGKYGVPPENPGTVNPAILTIGPSVTGRAA